MKNKLFTLLAGVTLFATASLPAYAYIGPGMGGGVIVAVLGIIGAFIVGLFGIVYFPIKRALKNKAKKKAEAEGKKSTADSDDEPSSGDSKE